MRLVLAGMLVAALSSAPLQCGGGSSDPELRTEDTPGDALWELSQQLEAKGDHEGAVATLRFLVARYPSDRHAPAARDALARAGADASSPR